MKFSIRRYWTRKKYVFNLNWTGSCQCDASVSKQIFVKRVGGEEKSLKPLLGFEYQSYNLWPVTFG